MAAKVVMVAVPTVLGIASIRVYRVSEAPTDGLVKREGLNIYTPLTSPAPLKFVQESPGLLESSLTTAREGVTPAYQAVKGACVSVKKGTISLYHVGQDVFYYLKDPPPEFLPRFGTITMAGLLGMFLARKGSRFNRLAVPLGLMTAATSVCYPAQAVAVCKVTGRKVYAAGQWSGATVSSLFTSKEPDAKELVASQSATVPNPESAGPPETSESRPPSDGSAQSVITSEVEVESAESAPGAKEPVGTVTTEDESSVTSSDPGPSETSAETKLETGEAALEGFAESTSSSEPQTTEPTPDTPADTALAALAEPAPAETISVAPAEAAYAEAAPEEAAPVEAAPVEAASVEAAPVEAASVEAAPVEAAPVEAASMESAPVEAAPMAAASVAAASMESAPVEAAPMAAASVTAASMESAPVEAASVAAASVESAPVEAAPMAAASVTAASMESAPVEAASVAAASVESAPVIDAPMVSAEPAPVEDAPVALLEAAAAETAPPDPAPMEAAPGEPADQAPAEPLAPPPVEEETTTEQSKEGAGFKPDPSLLDFGQSSPEDDDLYTTRS